MKQWLNHLKADMRLANITPDNAHERKEWRSPCRKADPAATRDSARNMMSDVNAKG